MRELISTNKNKKQKNKQTKKQIEEEEEEEKHRQGMNDQTFSPKPRKRGKATTIRLVRDARMVPWLTEIPIISLPKAANSLSVLSKQL